MHPTRSTTLIGTDWHETSHPLHVRARDDSPGFHTLGILTTPAAQPFGPQVGVLILSGGDQARAGAHRMFVHLARLVASCGASALRFDWPGLGDADGEPRSFEHLAPTVDELVAQWRALQPGLARVVLLGLCDGASVALMSLPSLKAAQLQGLVLLNPWVRSEASLAQSHLKHYYRQRLADPTFWRKLLAGGIRWRAWRDLGHNIARARAPHEQGFQDRMAAGWLGCDAPILLVTGEHDVTGNEFLTLLDTHPTWQQAAQHPGLSQVKVPAADHTFASEPAQLALHDHVRDWLTSVISRG